MRARSVRRADAAAHWFERFFGRLACSPSSTDNLRLEQRQATGVPMKTIRGALVFAHLMILSAVASSCGEHQHADEGVAPKELYRDHYVRLTKLEIQPRKTVSPHTHPGEEVGYVAEGSLLLKIGDDPC